MAPIGSSTILSSSFILLSKSLSGWFHCALTALRLSASAALNLLRFALSAFASLIPLSVTTMLW